MAANTTRDYLIRLANNGQELAALRAEVKEKTGGTYVNAIKAAIKAEDAPTFSAVVTEFMDDIRSNRDGLAERLGCETGKDGKTYKVPSAVSAAKSYVLDGFKYGFNFGTIKKPATYGALRKVVKASKEQERRENADEAETLRINTRDRWETLNDMLNDISDVDTLLAIAGSVGAALEAAKDAPEAEETEDSAESIAEAA